MKRTLTAVALTLALATSAQANGHGHGHRHGGGPGWVPWVGGAVIGAVIYDIYNRPVVVQQPPVIVQQPPVVIQQPRVYQNPGRLVIDLNAGVTCPAGLAPHFIEQVDFRGNTYRQFYACQ